MTSTRLLAASLAGCVLAAIVFIVWPQLDLVVAGLFYRGNGHFVGDTPLGRAVRHVCESVPFVIMAVAVILHVLRRSGRSDIGAPNGAGILMMAASLALGPGLLVNVVLKDHSHRPRPVQVSEFGGTAAFRPFYRLDGGCGSNCSFVSGEGSAAFWTVAPALLAPPPFRLPAVAAALAFGAVTGALRMAFGGHFLSDTVFGALLTWLVVLVSWRAIAARLESPAATTPDPGAGNV